MQIGRAGPQGIAALLGQMGEAGPVGSVGRQHRREIQEPEGPKDLKVPNAMQGHRAFILSDDFGTGKPPLLAQTSWWWAQSLKTGLRVGRSLVTGRKTGRLAI